MTLRLFGLGRGRGMLNTGEFLPLSLNVGRWTLSVGRFPF
jgi:hypothetical protein